MPNIENKIIITGLSFIIFLISTLFCYKGYNDLLVYNNIYKNINVEIYHYIIKEVNCLNSKCYEGSIVQCNIDLTSNCCMPEIVFSNINSNDTLIYILNYYYPLGEISDLWINSKNKCISYYQQYNTILILVLVFLWGICSFISLILCVYYIKNRNNLNNLNPNII
jgi:hypothetical protein